MPYSIAKNEALFLAILCATLIFLMSVFSVKYRQTVAPVRYRNVNDKMITEKPADKLFAYYILTESCLPTQYTKPTALGNARRCDVFVNSFRQACHSRNSPKHIHYIFKRTTWSEGRNLLYAYVRETGRQYRYHIFMDDDAFPIHTSHTIQFKKEFPGPFFFDRYVRSEKGLKDAIRREEDGNSAWRLFEDDVLSHSPAFAVTNYIKGSKESKVRVQENWNTVCAKGKEMPWIVTTFYLDEIFIAIHNEALPVLLPYTTKFENITWWGSGIIHIFRAKSLLYRSGIANYKVTIVNTKHREYPRGEIPRDILAQYLATDGKDMQGLIDEREIDWQNYDSWWKWEAALMRTRAICSAPIKFPVSKHYRLKYSAFGIH